MSDEPVGMSAAAARQGRRVSALAVFSAAGGALLIWGGVPTVSKMAVARIDPLMVGMLRTMLAGLAALPLVWGLAMPRPASGREWRLLAVSALGGYVLFPILFCLGLGYTSALHGAWIQATLPLLTGVIAGLVERRMPGGRWFLGVALAVLGEGLLFSDQGGGREGGGLLGDGLIFASGLAASSAYVAGARLSSHMPSLAVVFWSAIVGALLLAPLFALSALRVDWAGVGAEAWGAILYLAFLASLLAYAVWYWALSRGGIGRIGTGQFLQPLLGGAIAALVLGEAVSPLLMAAAIFIMFGVVLAVSRPKEEKT